MSRKHSASKPASNASLRRRGRRARWRSLTWLSVGRGVLLVVASGILLFGPKATPSVEITPAQAYAKYQQRAYFLDVRSQAEWNQFHIKGSTLIPLDQLLNRLNYVPEDKDIVVVCLSGHCALSGTSILQQAGFRCVSCLSGGLQA